GADALTLALREVFEWKGDNRYDSNSIYLIVYARPGRPAVHGENPEIGSGEAFNGLPNSGGGAVGMELSALLGDAPYPFQGTLPHELGHVFGLAHANCYGYSMRTNKSFMSYNPALATRGFEPSPGRFNPEEFFVLARNKRAFPHFEYVPARHNPAR